MSFKHPEFLYFLFAILIPIIIHLFNFRRYKKIWFSNIQFLKNITTETRKQNKLKHLVVLLFRILAIVAIVLAFAGPEFKKSATAIQNETVLKAVYVDNSFSMMAEGENGRLFDQALEQARGIVEQSPRDARFLFLNNEPVSGKRVLSKEAALPELDNFQRSFTNRNLSSVVRLAEKVASEKDFSAMEMYLLSDFQKYVSDFSEITSDTIGEYYFIPFEHTQKRNIYIDSCWIEDPVILPGKRIRLDIRIRNASTIDLEKIPLKVFINEKQKAAAGIDLKAGSQEIVTVNFTVDKAGWHEGLVAIEDYPITFDDQLYFSFQVSPFIHVLEIHNGNNGGQLAAFYGSDSVFRFQQENYRKVDYNRFSSYNLILLNSVPQLSTGLINQLVDYTNQGGNVLFIPNDQPDFQDANKLLGAMNAGRISELDTSQSRVVSIKLQHEIFKDAVTKIPENADLPVVQKHFRFTYNVVSGNESLVSMLNGDDFLVKKKTGQGQFYMLSVPLHEKYSNFASNALFVPIMYGAAISGETAARLFYIAGKDDLIRADISSATVGESPFILYHQKNDFSFIPEQHFADGRLELNVFDGITADGFYKLRMNDTTLKTYAFNFDRNESQMDFFTEDEIEFELSTSGLTNFQVLNSADKSFSEIINALQKESELWKLFIIFALLMLLAEVLILRFWK